MAFDRQPVEILADQPGKAAATTAFAFRRRRRGGCGGRATLPGSAGGTAGSRSFMFRPPPPERGVAARRRADRRCVSDSVPISGRALRVFARQHQQAARSADIQPHLGEAAQFASGPPNQPCTSSATQGRNTAAFRLTLSSFTASDTGRYLAGIVGIGQPPHAQHDAVRRNSVSTRDKALDVRSRSPASTSAPGTAGALFADGVVFLHRIAAIGQLGLQQPRFLAQGENLPSGDRMAYAVRVRNENVRQQIGVLLEKAGWSFRYWATSFWLHGLILLVWSAASIVHELCWRRYLCRREPTSTKPKPALPGMLRDAQEDVSPAHTR